MQKSLKNAGLQKERIDLGRDVKRCFSSLSRHRLGWVLYNRTKANVAEFPANRERGVTA